MKLRTDFPIVVLPVLRDALPPQAPEEHARLEASILEDGHPRDPLVVWKRDDEYVLVDGHHRYEICQRHNLPFRVVEREFESEADVLQWMVQLQLGRRNLSIFAKVEAVIKLKPKLSAVARAQGQKTYKVLGELSGTSHATVHRVDAILQAMEKNPALKESLPGLRTGEVPVMKVYTSLKAVGLAPEEPKNKLYRVTIIATSEEVQEKVFGYLSQRADKWGVVCKKS